MWKKISALAGSLLLAAVFLVVVAQAAEQNMNTAVASAAVSTVQDLRINEFMADNSQTISDTFGQFDDWVEIYNMGVTEVNLQGLYLTDNITESTQFQITRAVTIPAGGFIVVWADSDPEQNSDTEIHTNFGLGAGGDAFYIIDTNGSTVIDSYAFGAQSENVSEGRLPDGTGSFQPFALGGPTPPSPGRSNAIQPPFISSVTQDPIYPTSSDSVQVTAVITDDGGVQTATLHYKVNNGAFTPVNMSAAGNNYTAVIPAQNTDDVVRYYVTAEDGIASSTSPLGAPSETYLYVVGFEAPTVVINEIMADNVVTLLDPDGISEYDDWIELHNYGASPVSLDNLYLSDNTITPTMFAIPNGLSIPAGGYLLFYADNTIAQGDQHTNFALSANGDEIGLYGANGLVAIDFYDFGNSDPDESRSRLPNATGNFSKTDNATPGFSNDDLGIVISNVSHSPVQPMAGTPVVISATITTGAPGGSIDSATVTYVINNGIEQFGTMSNTGGDVFEFTIDGLKNTPGAIVEYSITAVDEYTVGSESYTLGEVAESPFYGYVVGYEAPELYINEYMVSNTMTLEDPDEPGEFPDWIELYNPSDSAVDLGALDLYLTDNPNDPTLFPLTGVIPAKGFALFYADDDPSQGSLHTNFRLSSAGGFIGLYGAQGFVEIVSRSYGPQTADISEGLLPDGQLPYIQFDSDPRPPTPGQSNDQQGPLINNRTQTPTLPTGADAVTITVDVTDEDAITAVELIYTVNGGAAVTLTMSNSGGDTYQAVIPAQASGAAVAYYFRATDSNDNESLNPFNAPTGSYSYEVYDAPLLYINEYMANNMQTLEDPNEPGSYPDWFELYNGSDTAVTLAGLYLSDDAANTDQFLIGDITIPASGFVLFYAGDAPVGATAEQAKYYTGFALGNTGDSIILSGGSEGQIPIDSITFPAQSPDVSEGRYPDGSAMFRRFNVPTPGASNVLNGPTISNTAVNGIPQANSNVTIQTTVVDDGEIVDIVIRYRTGSGSYVDGTVTPVSGQPNTYRTTVPGQPNGTTVEYYVWAVDNDGVESTDPADWETGGPYSYTVGQLNTDFQAYLPVIITR